MFKFFQSLRTIFHTATFFSFNPSYPLNKTACVKFASIDEGRKIITTRDDYIERLSPFDRSAKTKVNHEVTEAEFLDYMGNQVTEWTVEEKQELAQSIKRFKDKTAHLSLNFPKDIYFVKTTGEEEGGAAYTRSNAVFFSQQVMNPRTRKNNKGKNRFDYFVFHELFHVLTRANSDLKEKLYAIIGFEKCDEVKLPESLAKRKISNPDAPLYDHFIRVRIGYKEHLAIPVIYSREEKFDNTKHKSFFELLRFKLLLTAPKHENPDAVMALYDGDGIRLVSPDDVDGFYEQVGKNTRYIIHPEEILADNFVYMLNEREDLSNPEIIAGMEKIFIRHAMERNPMISHQFR